MTAVPAPAPDNADFPLLRVQDLRTQIDTPSGTVRAVDGVDLQINRREKVAIVGESGCGKSTLALSIIRLLPSHSARIVEGQIVFENRDLTRLSERELRLIRGHRIGMVFQDPMTALNPLLRIGLQIMEPMEVHLHWSRDKAREHALELLMRARVPRAERVMSQHPHELSGGMRQRVALAMAVACRPQLIIADEPTTALDVTVQAEVISILNDLAEEEQSAVIFISHNLNLVAEFADRIVVMYAGKIAEIGSTREVYENASHPYTQDLLRSVLRIDEPRRDQLVVIPGQPPDLSSPPGGCAYHPRCRLVRDYCLDHAPPLEACPSDDHRAACWVTCGDL